MRILFKSKSTRVTKAETKTDISLLKAVVGSEVVEEEEEEGTREEQTTTEAPRVRVFTLLSRLVGWGQCHYRP